MLFQHVIGQNSPKATLRQMVAHNHLPHALLFLCNAGSGGLSLAWALASFILCEQPSAEDACGHCPNCQKMAKLIHPDVHFSFPTVGTGVISDHLLPQWRSALLQQPYMEINDWLQHIDAENKQGNINKDECVNIIKKLSLKSFSGKKKVLILWLPEYLGNEGNRLLKLIEEPPDDTQFILVSENPERILRTIISRCQLVRINALSDEDVRQGLISRHQTNPDQAEAIAFLCAGNFNEAAKMLQQEEADQAGQFLDWMRICYKGLPQEQVQWVDQFAGQGRENQKHFLRYALHFWRELAIAKTLGIERVRLREREKQTATGMAKVVEMDQLEAITTLLDDCILHVERNANPKILFLDATIRINHIIKHWSQYQQIHRHEKPLRA